MLSRKSLHLALFAIALAATPGTAVAVCVMPKTLDGIWKANDGGTYQVRLVGNVIWWVGMSADNGRHWTHVFRGIRSGNLINGQWADVGERVRGAGTLSLRVRDNASMDRTASAGSGYAGMRWRRPCPDTVGIPVDE